MFTATLTMLMPLALPPAAPQTSRPKKVETAEQAEKKKAPLPSSKDGDDKALGEISEFIKQAEVDKSKGNWKVLLKKPPILKFDDRKDYFWHMRTNHGDITIKLMPEVAPMHVSNCIYLTRLGYYDDLTFHRVIPRFMAQGGCPLGSGTGHPGYMFDGEFDPKVKHDQPGMLSTANAGPGTDGSQFFLTFVPTKHLDGKHTIYGQVTDGMPTLKALESRGSSPAGRTREKLYIKEATISVAPKPQKEEATDGQQ